jgi:hypothetical protein
MGGVKLGLDPDWSNESGRCRQRHLKGPRRSQPADRVGRWVDQVGGAGRHSKDQGDCKGQGKLEGVGVPIVMQHEKMQPAKHQEEEEKNQHPEPERTDSGAGSP